MHLERTFLSRLNRYTTKLLEIFRKKGGTAGTKIKPLLDSLNEVGYGILFFGHFCKIT
ncbi:unnamed protein product [Arctogadus glacialis]